VIKLNDLLQLALNNVNDFVLVLDDDLFLLYLNDMARELLQLESPSIIHIFSILQEHRIKPGFDSTLIANLEESVGGFSFPIYIKQNKAFSVIWKLNAQN